MYPSMLYICCIYLLWIPLTPALTLPPVQDFSGLTSLASPKNKTFPGPASLVLDLPSLEPDLARPAGLPDPVCNGDLLGFDMNRYSCLQAWATIPTTHIPVEFGDRLNGTFQVQLPRRFSGPDGTCAIDVFHKDGVISDVTSFMQISSAAERLYGLCVARGDQRPQGGWIRNLGQNKGLVVVLSLYQPSVACFGPRFVMQDLGQALQNVLALVQVGTERQKFGPEGEPWVQVVVPATYTVSDPMRPWLLHPRLTVDVEHRTAVTARWFDVWAGAAAVTAMCMVRGYAGISGLQSGLSVTMDAIRGVGVENGSAVY